MLYIIPSSYKVNIHELLQSNLSKNDIIRGRLACVNALSKTRINQTIISLHLDSNIFDNHHLLSNFVIKECFNFKDGIVHIAVLFNTINPLSKQDKDILIDDINGAMADSWGESYQINSPTNSDIFDKAVSGWEHTTSKSILQMRITKIVSLDDTKTFSVDEASKNGIKAIKFNEARTGLLTSDYEYPTYQIEYTNRDSYIVPANNFIAYYAKI